MFDDNCSCQNLFFKSEIWVPNFIVVIFNKEKMILEISFNNEILLIYSSLNISF